MAGESTVAFAANVAANAGVHFHVLLQCCLGLETLPTKKAKDGHVRACKEKKKQKQRGHRLIGGGNWMTLFQYLFQWPVARLSANVSLD